MQHENLDESAEHPRPPPRNSIPARDSPGQCRVGCSYAAKPILRRSTAQRRHASAHRWQCSCFADSAPHASQIPVQTRQRAPENVEPRLMNPAASQQTSAQSRSRRMHSAIIFTSVSLRHPLAQCSHASAHSSHALTQLWCWRWAMGHLFSVFAPNLNRARQPIARYFRRQPSFPVPSRSRIRRLSLSIVTGRRSCSAEPVQEYNRPLRIKPQVPPYRS